jgi:hypothetical protein
MGCCNIVQHKIQILLVFTVIALCGQAFSQAIVYPSNGSSLE